MFFDVSMCAPILAPSVPVEPLPRNVCVAAPAIRCSSVNVRTFASATLAPSFGPE